MSRLYFAFHTFLYFVWSMRVTCWAVQLVTPGSVCRASVSASNARCTSWLHCRLVLCWRGLGSSSLRMSICDSMSLPRMMRISLLGTTMKVSCLMSSLGLLAVRIMDLSMLMVVPLVLVECGAVLPKIQLYRLGLYCRSMSAASSGGSGFIVARWSGSR